MYEIKVINKNIKKKYNNTNCNNLIQNVLKY